MKRDPLVRMKASMRPGANRRVHGGQLGARNARIARASMRPGANRRVPPRNSPRPGGATGGLRPCRSCSRSRRRGSPPSYSVAPLPAPTLPSSTRHHGPAATTRRRRPPGWQTSCCYPADRPCWTWKAVADTAARVRAVTSAPVVALLTACAPRGQDADQVTAPRASHGGQSGRAAFRLRYGLRGPFGLAHTTRVSPSARVRGASASAMRRPPPVSRGGLGVCRPGPQRRHDQPRYRRIPRQGQGRGRSATPMRRFPARMARASRA